MRKADFYIMACIAALSLLPLAFLFAFARGGHSAPAVTVTQRGKTVYEGPLSEDATIALDGVTVAVENGAAYVKKADCPDGLCKKAGRARAGKPVICLPNGVIVSVTAGGEEGDGDAPDAVVY